jgi:hypothetical protein
MARFSEIILRRTPEMRRMTMKRHSIAVVIIGLVSLGALPALAAGKVELPKAGNYAFDFCPIGHGRSLNASDKWFVMSYDIDAVLRSTPPGGAFDRMGARCYGIYRNFGGQQRENGVCELTDLDGDKWWMDYHGGAQGGGGTYTAVTGTGKYAGMELKGEYRIDNKWGNPAKEVAFTGCNPNKGSYQLR